MEVSSEHLFIPIFRSTQKTGKHRIYESANYFNFIFYAISMSGQNVEVEGQILAKDVNRIATFQSTGKNAFIRLVTNDDDLRGTNVGYFYDSDAEDGEDPYFFIDTPSGAFGEFVINENGSVYIGDEDFEPLNFTQPRLIVQVAGGQHGAIRATCVYGTALTAISENSSGIDARSKTWHGIIGNSESSNHFDFLAQTNDGSMGYGESSSKRWKTNINNIPNPIEKLSRFSKLVSLK